MMGLNKVSRIEKLKFFSMFNQVMAGVVASFSGVLLFGILGFIFYRAIQGFSSYGLKAILGTTNFDISGTAGESGTQVSFWMPFTATLITTFIALLIAVPLGIKTSVFLKFRVNKKYQKILRVAIETLAGIPSVIFGLFASESLKMIVGWFGISSYSILNSSIMLSFMILPTIIAMTYNSLQSVDESLLSNSIALGCTKTKAIYKVYKKAAKSGIIVGVILATGRAIGETMALSMLLQSENDYSQVWASGNLFAILSSNVKTISVIISTNMFTENSTDTTKSLLFAFGFILFVIIMVLNLVVLRITRTKKNIKLPKFFLLVKEYQHLFFSKFYFCIEYIFFPGWRNRKIVTENDMIMYVKKRNEEYKFRNIYSWYKMFWEVFSVVLCFIFLTWLSLNIISVGTSAWASPTSTVFDYTKNTTGQALLNTILIIMVGILISLPVSLLTAVYLNEFTKNKIAKKTIFFFLDCLGSTPSILFGMFGLLFFIYTLGWTSQGIKGFSLIAGALTVSIVILPSFSRSIQLALNEVPQEMRLNALALGCTKSQVVRKVVLPAALTGLATSVVLSIGRILSETAPLYLTAGIAGSSQTALVNSGQTLTTRIYAQLTNTNLTESKNTMYESAFLTLLLILVLIIIGYYIIPNWRIISLETKFLFYKIKNRAINFFAKKNKVNVESDLQ